MLGIIGGVRRIPGLGRLADRFEVAYLAMRTCLAPLPLALTVGLSVVPHGSLDT